MKNNSKKLWLIFIISYGFFSECTSTNLHDCVLEFVRLAQEYRQRLSMIDRSMKEVLSEDQLVGSDLTVTMGRSLHEIADILSGHQESSIDLNAYDKDGYTALHYAVLYGIKNIIQEFMKHTGVHFDELLCPTRDGRTIDMLAEQGGFSEEFHHLLAGYRTRVEMHSRYAC